MIKIIFICVALMPLIVIVTGKDDLPDILHKMAENGETIYDILQPSKNGILEYGFNEVSYKGTLLDPRKRTEVAMKFTPLLQSDKAIREYEIYTYLNAINRTDVQQYGIPTVYYYGTWSNYVLLAISLLDSEFNDRAKRHNVQGVDILIIMQEFVRISKYIHSRGVLHGDINLDNLMFRGKQGFIINYNTATKLYETTNTGTNVQKRSSRYDWKIFLLSISKLFNIKINWFEMGDNPRTDAIKMMRQIEKIDSQIFKKVLTKFATYTFEIDLKGKNSRLSDAPNFSFYDEFYFFINEEISKLGVQHSVSWSTEEGSNVADIRTIQNQFENVNGNYPKVNFCYFQSEEVYRLGKKKVKRSQLKGKKTKNAFAKE